MNSDVKYDLKNLPGSLGKEPWTQACAPLSQVSSALYAETEERPIFVPRPAYAMHEISHCEAALSKGVCMFQ